VIVVERPGQDPLRLEHALFDFNGTLALDGALRDDLREDLAALARQLSCLLLTADTHGTAAGEAAAIGWPLHVVRHGQDKAAVVRRLDGGVVAVGNGHNDVPMFEAAALSIAVIGPEGAATKAVLAADVVVRDIHEAVGLLLHPRRLTATLRP
jgi:P-type E1-E2 ATPase